MESLDAIRKMNEKHPPGRRSTSIVDLCARVEALEKENKELREMVGTRENAPGPAQEAPGQAGLPVALSCAADAELLAFLGQCPCSLKRICDQFRVPYAPPPYTPEARAIRNQLQRLRKDKRVCSYGGRWELW